MRPVEILVQLGVVFALSFILFLACRVTHYLWCTVEGEEVLERECREVCNRRVAPDDAPVAGPRVLSEQELEQLRLEEQWDREVGGSGGAAEAAERKRRLLADIAEEARRKAEQRAETAAAAAAKQLAAERAAAQKALASAKKLKEEAEAKAKAVAAAAAEAKRAPECSICLEQVHRSTPGHCETRCRHHFHVQCLGKWMAHGDGQHSCPLCKAHISEVLVNRKAQRADQLVAFYRAAPKI